VTVGALDGEDVRKWDNADSIDHLALRDANLRVSIPHGMRNRRHIHSIHEEVRPIRSGVLVLVTPPHDLE